MKRELSCRCAAAIVATLLSLTSGAGGLPQPQAVFNPILATYVNLVVVPVTVQDRRNGVALEGLRAQDFEVFDNGKQQRLSLFRWGSDPNWEFLSIWLVVPCTESHKKNDISLREVNLQPAFDRFEPEDRIGVAHWCPHSNDSGVDLDPTRDRIAARAALKTAWQRESAETASSEKLDGLEEMLKKISRLTDPQMEPHQVLIFLGPNEARPDINRVAQLARAVASHTSLSVYSIRDQSRRAASASTGGAAVTLCEETGGQVLFAKKSDWAYKLTQIVDGFRSRYTIAFSPSNNDEGWHDLKVRLTKDASVKQGQVLLRYRSGYWASRGRSRYAIAETPSGADDAQNAALLPAVGAQTNSSGISFEVSGALYEREPTSARFTLRFPDDEVLSWSPLSHGSHRSRVTVEIAFLSLKGVGIQRTVGSYDITREPADAWAALNQQVVIVRFLDCPSDTDRVRFIVRDDMTGRIGTQELSMETIRSAHKLARVIA